MQVVLLVWLSVSLCADWPDPRSYQKCGRVEVRSNMHKVNDMVKEGQTVGEWSDESPSPVIIGADKQVDYIYFVVTSDPVQYTLDNFALLQDDTQWAHSKLELDPSHKDTKYAHSHQEKLYAMKVIYHCASQGGALITYRLTMTIPGCGTAYVQYSKLCGNPLQNRKGLQVDMQLGSQLRNTIVKDGMVANPSYFDADLDSDVVRIPFNQPSTQFHMYIKREQEGVDDIDLLGMGGLANAVVQRIRVDSDQTMINVKPKSILLHGGIIDNNPKTLVLSYECLGRGEDALIEVNIQLKNYKDITLFFVKQCESKQTYSLFSTVGKHKDTHWGNYIAHIIFYGLVVYVLVMLGRTVCRGRVSVENVPMYGVMANLGRSIGEYFVRKVGATQKFKTLYEADKQDYELVASQLRTKDTVSMSYGTI